MSELFYLNCLVGGMLVATIPSSVIPSVGSSMFVDDPKDTTLLGGKTWDVLHVNYAFRVYETHGRAWGDDGLIQVNITLIESKQIRGNESHLDFPQNKKS